MAKTKQCKAKKTDGTQCGGYAMAGSDYCFSHNPKTVDRHREAARAGGRVGKSITPGPDSDEIRIGSSEDLLTATVQTINEVRRGEIDAKTANCVGYLLNVAGKALEAVELRREIDELRRLVDARNTED